MRRHGTQRRAADSLVARTERPAHAPCVPTGPQSSDPGARGLLARSTSFAVTRQQRVPRKTQLMTCTDWRLRDARARLAVSPPTHSVSSGDDGRTSAPSAGSSAIVEHRGRDIQIPCAHMSRLEVKRETTTAWTSWASAMR